MQNSDSISYDSIPARPLPKWLIDQKEGLCTIEPEKVTMKEDRSLQMSFTFTGIFIILVVVILSVYIVGKTKKQ